MNKTERNFTRRGLYFFVLLTGNMLAILYAMQTELTVMLFICAAISIVLSLGLLFGILKTNKVLEKTNQEVIRLRQREKFNLQKEQQKTDDSLQNVEIFKCNEILARIIPIDETFFDSAEIYAEKVLQNIAKELDIVQGLVFILNKADQLFHISGQYAYYSEEQPYSFPLGETLSGQVAKSRQMLNLKKIPQGYITVISGLGKSSPSHLIIIPIVHNSECIGIMEIASFKPFGENEELLTQRICELMANRLNELRR